VKEGDCLRECVDDAFALVRVLVEKIINGEYLLLTGSEAALDFAAPTMAIPQS
jgi:hypothetical protein